MGQARIVPPPSELPPPAPGRTALVLSGGGARGAYQAGVLRGLLDLGVISPARSAFPILIGASAGALNAGMLAAHSDAFDVAMTGMEDLWGTIRADHVFRTDLRAIAGNSLRWVRDLSLGGILRHTSSVSLLDTAPLRRLLTERIAFRRIQENIESGALCALAVPATDMHTADGVLFVQGCPDIRPWHRSRWTIEHTAIQEDHLLASSAIPMFFPPVKLGERYLGDGSIRNTAPLSPAIRLGAERIVAIGVRRACSALPPPVRRSGPPNVAQIAASLLDAVMLDAVETDVEHSERLNDGISRMPGGNGKAPLRWIDVLWLTPSVSIRDIAEKHRHAIPGLITYLLRGLGNDGSVTELTSYLLFDSGFCRELMRLGRRDVEARSEEILRFFARPAETDGRSPSPDTARRPGAPRRPVATPRSPHT
jgi:NTE family protein